MSKKPIPTPAVEPYRHPSADVEYAIDPKTGVLIVEHTDPDQPAAAEIAAEQPPAASEEKF